MDNFKVNKKHDQGMEMVFFVVRLRICIGGVSFKLRLGFLCFVEMGVFGKSLQVCFLRVQLLSQFQELQFQDPIFRCQKIPFKVPKVPK